MAPLPPLPSPEAAPPAAASARAEALQASDARLEAWLQARVWRGHQLAVRAERGVASGFPPLDAELPGGGWPKRALTELILPQAGIGEMRLLAAALVTVQRGERARHGPGAPPGARPVMLFDPPARLCAEALQALGLDLSELLVVQARTPALPGTDSLWALEQALKSGHVGAVLAWLPPRLSPERLRRLQLAASAHDGPAFVLREWTAQHRPSASPLRLALQPAGADALRVRVLKRRGPPLEQSLLLALPPVLSALAAQRARRGATAVPATAPRADAPDALVDALVDAKADARAGGQGGTQAPAGGRGGPPAGGPPAGPAASAGLSRSGPAAPPRRPLGGATFVEIT